MKQMSSGKIAVAAAIFACMTLFSFGWSERGGVSLSIEGAQARVGRPLTPASVAGVSRRHYRRTGYGPAAVGAGLAAGAIGTAAAATATSPWGYYGGEPYGWNGASFASSPWGDYDCRAPHAYECRPYASKDWGYH
jgi:hypothetical protein